MLVYHIRKLPKSSLANMVYVEQIANSWPGLASEVTKICSSLGVVSAHQTDLPKQKYKQIVTNACYARDKKEIKDKMSSLEKCSELIGDEFKLQDYMKSKSLKDIRELFRIKTRMNHLRANFPGKPGCKAEGGMDCIGCGESIETNSHVTNCKSYADLLVGRDLSKDADLVQFFRDVMSRREKLNKKSHKRD